MSAITGTLIGWLGGGTWGLGAAPSPQAYADQHIRRLAGLRAEAVTGGNTLDPFALSEQIDVWLDTRVLYRQAVGRAVPINGWRAA